MTLEQFARALLDDVDITPENLAYWAKEYQHAYEHLSTFGDTLAERDAEIVRLKRRVAALEDGMNPQEVSDIDAALSRTEKP